MGYMLANLIGAFQMVLFVRAIASWFPDVARSSFGQFIFGITEPILMPVRSFMNKHLNIGLPIDLSFLVVYFGLDILRIMLY